MRRAKERRDGGGEKVKRGGRGGRGRESAEKRKIGTDRVMGKDRDLKERERERGINRESSPDTEPVARQLHSSSLKFSLIVFFSTIRSERGSAVTIVTTSAPRLAAVPSPE